MYLNPCSNNLYEGLSKLADRAIMNIVIGYSQYFAADIVLR